MSSRIRSILYCAAHGGFAGKSVPLGGGAAIANLLLDEWTRTRPFDVTLVAPAILGAAAPGPEDLVRFNERQYAAFCAAFSQAATTEALRHDPRETAILVNDISEGPDFERLARAGFHIVTIYHVDVIAYIAEIYLRGWISAPVLTRAWERLRPALGPLAPRILRLIFEQQRSSLRYSSCVVVPSTGMRELLLAGDSQPDGPRIEVIPWGAPAAPAIAGARAQVEASFGVPAGARLAVCLSRLSPEKGHDLLLEGLIEAERGGILPQPLCLLICGAPAFMHGARCARQIRTLAGRLRQTRVIFTGHLTGFDKRAALEAADLYVFPSRHESYGLTLAEALAAGVPAVALDQPGSREILTPECGVLVARAPARTIPLRLAGAVAELLQAPERRVLMGEAARQWAARHRFSTSAERLASLLQAADSARA